MKVNDKYNVKIIDQETSGRGVTKINDFVVFVDGALINDTCEIRIANVKKNYAEAEIVNITMMSNERVDNDCLYYPSCGGCDLRHQKYEYQLAFKKKKVITSLERIGKLSNIKVLDVIPNNPYYYRNKVTLKVDGNKLGFYKKNTYEVIDIDKCLISNDKINECICEIKSFINKYPNHNIKEVFIRSEKEVMIKIISYDFKLSNELINVFNGHVDSLLLNDEVLYGNDHINMSLLDYNFKISSNSFFQVNKEQTERLYNKIISYIKQENINIALDLYCGVGTITALLSKCCNRVIGIEVVKDAIDNAEENIRLNNIDNAEFINDKVENVINKISENIDVIVMDPPRNGSDKITLDTIIKLKPKVIIYVSCNPTTLARDLNALNNNYKVEEITPFDMFPETEHVECVCKLVVINGEGEHLV